MTGLSEDELICELLWALGRRHGWSHNIPVQDLVDDTDAADKKWARDVCRNELKSFHSIRHHPGHDTITLNVPHRDICQHLRNHCNGYSELRIKATFKIDEWD